MASSDHPLVSVTGSGSIKLASEFDTLVTALSPFGVIGKTIVTIVAIHEETARMRIQMEAVRHDCAVQHRKIDAAERIMLAAIEERRYAMDRFFEHAQQERFEQRQINAAISTALLQLSSQVGTGRETKDTHKTIRSLTNALVAISSVRTASLAALIHECQLDLQNLPAIPGYLPPG